MKTRTISLFLLLALSLALLAGCGGSSAPAEEEAQAAESEFLLGSWFATTASKDGEEKDTSDIFGGRFMLYFSDNGECTMAIDDKRAIVNWTLNDDGTVTLSGDDTYPVTFPDDSRTTMVMVVQGIDVTLEKYEDE